MSKIVIDAADGVNLAVTGFDLAWSPMKGVSQWMIKDSSSWQPLWNQGLPKTSTNSV